MTEECSHPGIRVPRQKKFWKLHFTDRKGFTQVLVQEHEHPPYEIRIPVAPPMRYSMEPPPRADFAQIETAVFEITYVNETRYMPTVYYQEI